ncbi:unnamed protein product [Urochloa decumbens]|uniref:Uncharacterized protein n=1 Tax=Urochloa decumbens TaxID=240449 RepID=A0ABC9ARE4_9POAL
MASSPVLKMVVPVAACVVLVLLSMGSPVMADIQDDCRTICRPKCDDLTSDVCTSIKEILPTILSNLDAFGMTCRVRVSTLCRTLCINICTLNTLTPGAPTPAPGSAAAPPPCKP